MATDYGFSSTLSGPDYSVYNNNYEDQSSFVPKASTSSGLINSLTGFLGKAADTALDIYAIKESNKAIGSAYPTGQVDPAAVKSSKTAQDTSSAQTRNYMPYIIGGVALVAFVTVIIVVAKKK